MAGEQPALEAVTLRNNFYRDNFRRIIWILLLSLILNVVLVCSFIFFSAKPAQKYFFAVTDAGQLIPLYPTVQAVVTNDTVLNWVTSNVPKIYALDFVHYREELNDTQQYFTPGGWSQFQTAFAAQLKTILSDQLITSAVPADVPVVTGTGVFDGVYKWQVQIPMVISLQQGNTVTTKKVLLTIVVDRVNNVSAHQILGISQIIQQVQQ